MKKILPIAAVVFLLLGIGLQFAPDIVSGKSGKIDEVIFLYESKNQSVPEASVMAGVTPLALKKVNKLRKFDQNEIPESRKAMLQPILVKLGVPSVVLVRGGKPIASRKISPKETDATLAAYLAKNGGF